MARERCTTNLLDGETLEAADGFWLLDCRLRGSGSVVDIRPSVTLRGEEKKIQQERAEWMGAEDASLEDGECYGL